jgi:hypothetical protein
MVTDRREFDARPCFEFTISLKRFTVKVGLVMMLFVERTQADLEINRYRYIEFPAHYI